MNGQSILQRVHALAKEEQALCEADAGSSAGARLTEIEYEFDRCWEMLRRSDSHGASPEEKDAACAGVAQAAAPSIG